MNPAALLLFALATAGLVIGTGYGLVVGEQSGTALLIAIGLASAVGALAIVATQGRDIGPANGGDASALMPAQASPWPFGMGLAALILAVGMATGGGLVLLGLAAVAVAGIGWFSQSWSQHPTWTAEQNERVGSRLVMPLVLPLGVTALVALMAIAFSRILLAVPKNGSVIIALVAALVILGGGVAVAMRGLSRSAVLGVLTVGALATAGLGIGGAVAGEREFHHPEAGEQAEAGGEEEMGGDPEAEPDSSISSEVELSADNLSFDKDSLELPAGEPSIIKFSNAESQPHNVAIRDGSGDTVFRPEGGGIITGPGEEADYDVPPLVAGDYTFFCEVHPAQMTGDLTVV